MKELILSIFSKEKIIEIALGLLVRFLQQKPKGKFAVFITSKKMQNTIAEINKHYPAFLEAAEKENIITNFTEDPNLLAN